MNKVYTRKLSPYTYPAFQLTCPIISLLYFSDSEDLNLSI